MQAMIFGGKNHLTLIKTDGDPFLASVHVISLRWRAFCDCFVLAGAVGVFSGLAGAPHGSQDSAS